MFFNHVKDKFKIQIVTKKVQKVSHVSSTKMPHQKKPYGSSLFSRKSSANASSVKKSKPLLNKSGNQQLRKNTRPLSMGRPSTGKVHQISPQPIYKNVVDTQPENIVDIFNIHSYESVGLPQTRRSTELFSNEYIKSPMIRNCIKKTFERKHEIQSDHKESPTQPKYGSSLRLYIDKANNPIHCSSITLKKPPTHKRNLIIPSKSLAKSQKIQPDSRRKIKIFWGTTSRVMSFHTNESGDILYMRKLKSFFDFLFKVNFSNRIYVPLAISDFKISNKKKVYVGYGNNHQLVKQILRKRFWIQVCDTIEESTALYWTQNSLKEIHKFQKYSSSAKRYSYGSAKGNKGCSLNMIESNKQIMSQDDACLVQNFIKIDGYIIPEQSIYKPGKITNHLPQNGCLTQKKKLFKTLFHYYNTHLKKDPFEVIPITYNVKNRDDPEFKRFVRDYESLPDSLWIVKPGQDTNRGEGISLIKYSHIQDLLSQQRYKTYIIQKYILNPLLYNNRKFDIRHFMLLTSVNGVIKAYWYTDGYLRTCCEEFSLENFSKFTHLTNDAIQRQSPNYGRFQQANKVSYSEFQRYLDLKHWGQKISLQEILEQMKNITIDIIKANYSTIDHNRRQSNFQLYGLDFMIDRNYKPWLIEVNCNPCLETAGYVLQRIIPGVIEQTMRIGLDPLMPPDSHFPAKSCFGLNDHYIQTCKFELIFDEMHSGAALPINYQVLDSEEQDQGE